MNAGGLVKEAVDSGVARWGARCDASFEQFLVSHETYRPMAGLDTWAAAGSPDRRVADGLRPFVGHEHRSWTYDIPGPVWCEPTFGRVFDARGRLLRRSSTYWHMHANWTASMGAYAAGRLVGPERRVPEVVSLREPLTEHTFWHFHDDVLGRLLGADDYGIASDAPLLIGPRLWESSFFQSARRRPGLRDRRWIVHDRLVRAERCVVPVHGSLRSETPKRLQELLADAPRSTSRQEERRFFLARAPHRPRALRNQQELSSVLRRRCELETVDADAMAFDAQVDLFTNAALVVAVHGAGLANLIHRVGADCTLIELFPSDYIHPHFAWLARAASFKYSAVVGSALHPTDQSFEVSADDVIAALTRVGSPCVEEQE